MPIPTPNDTEDQSIGGRIISDRGRTAIFHVDSCVRGPLRLNVNKSESRKRGALTLVGACSTWEVTSSFAGNLVATVTLVLLSKAVSGINSIRPVEVKARAAER